MLKHSFYTCTDGVECGIVEQGEKEKKNWGEIFN